MAGREFQPVYLLRLRGAGARLGRGKTGKDCTFKVTFSPTQTGTRTGTLSIKDSALSSVQEIPLTGRGT